MKGIQSNGFLPIIAQAIAEMEEQHRKYGYLISHNLHYIKEDKDGTYLS